MMKTVPWTMLVAGLVTVAIADEEAQSPWRVSVSGTMRYGFSSSFTVDPTPAIRALPRAKTGSKGRPLAEAQSGTVVDGVYVFDNGFIDPVDSAGIPGETWNWQITNASDYQGTALHFKEEYSSSKMTEKTHTLSDSWSDDLGGVTLEVGRTLFRSGRFGVDVALGMSWFEDVECLNASGVVYERTVVTERGTVERTLDMGYALEPDMINSDGSVGAGTYDGPGPVLAVPTNDSWMQTQASVAAGSSRKKETTSLVMNVSGEYSTMDFRLVVEPFVELTDWLTLRAIVGAAVVDSELSVEARATVSGTEIYRKKETFDETSLCGILGAGVELSFCENIFLTGRFEAFLGLDDLEVESEVVRGSVSQGDYQACVGLGVRF